MVESRRLSSRKNVVASPTCANARLPWEPWRPTSSLRASPPAASRTRWPTWTSSPAYRTRTRRSTFRGGRPIARLRVAPAKPSSLPRTPPACPLYPRRSRPPQGPSYSRWPWSRFRSASGCAKTSPAGGNEREAQREAKVTGEEEMRDFRDLEMYIALRLLQWFCSSRKLNEI